MSFADFRHQREIADVLRAYHPLQKALQPLPSFSSAEARVALQHPSTFSRGPKGTVVEVDFRYHQQAMTAFMGASGIAPTLGGKRSASGGVPLTDEEGRAGDGAGGGDASAESRLLTSRGTDTTEVSVVPVNSPSLLSELAIERIILTQKSRRSQSLFKKQLQRQLHLSQFRLALARNGVPDPQRAAAQAQSNNTTILSVPHREVVLPRVLQCEGPQRAGTLGQAIEAKVSDEANRRVEPSSRDGDDSQSGEASFPASRPGALRNRESRKSFFFTDVPEWMTEYGDASSALGDGGVPSAMTPVPAPSGVQSVDALSAPLGVVIPPKALKLLRGAPQHALHMHGDTVKGVQKESRSPGDAPVAITPSLTPIERMDDDNAINTSMTSASFSLTSEQERELLQRQKQRDDYFRFPDVPACEVLRRGAANSVVVDAPGLGNDQAPDSLASRRLLPPLNPNSTRQRKKVGDAVDVHHQRQRTTTTMRHAISPTPVDRTHLAVDRSEGLKMEVEDIRMQGLPSGEKHRAVLALAHASSEAFLNASTAELERVEREQRAKYTKKFKALRVEGDAPLPFHASASQILHHVGRLIVREERASARRDAHNKVIEQFEVIEGFCLSHFKDASALQLVYDTRRILVDEDTTLTPELYSLEIIGKTPPQLFLLNDLCTVAVHLAEVFQVSRDEACRVIREHAKAFVVDRRESLLNRLE